MMAKFLITQKFNTIANDNELHVFNCMWLQIDWMKKEQCFFQ